jgi:hypothetical protein
VFVGFLFGLQGPFSILLLPVLVGQRLWMRDSRNKELVFCVALAALLQCLSLIMNKRGLESFNVSNDEIVFSNDPMTFTISSLLSTLSAMKDGFVYNVNDRVGVTILIACLLLALFGIVVAVSNAKDEKWRRNTCVFLAFAAVSLIAGLSTLYALLTVAKADFDIWLGCLMQNNRYLFIPHCLLIIGLPVLLFRYLRISFVAMVGFIYISVVNYSFAERFPTYFASYINMGRFMDADALMNPTGYYRVEPFPWNSWFYSFRRTVYDQLAESRVIPLMPPKPDVSSRIYLQTDVICPDTSDIAMKIHVFSSGPVKVDAELSNGRHVYSAHRLYDVVVPSLFFYNGVSNVRPKGDILMDFAFPYPGEGAKLEFTFQPYERAGDESADSGVKTLTVREMTLYCLPPPEER